MASDLRGRGHGFKAAPFPPETRAPRTDTENHRHPADPSCAQYCSVSGGNHSFRLLLEETAFQALIDEPWLRRPLPVHDILPGAEDSLLSLPFPKKLWRIVNSNEFASIWWDDGGTCIVINEKLFQKEVLERNSPNKVFETKCMKSFIRQLNLYGFSKMCLDGHMSVRLTRVVIQERPVYVTSKLRFYCSPYFKRNSPHLLVRMKRRVGIKSALRQKRSQAEALESPPVLTATEQQDPASTNEDNEEIPKSQELDSPATQVRSDSAPLGIPVTVPEPTVVSDDAPITQPAIRQPKSSQAHVTQLGDVTAELPCVFFTVPSTQIDSYGPVVGVPATTPRILNVHNTQLPLPGLLPFCHHWVALPVLAAWPAASVSALPHPPTPIHSCPHCHCVLEFMPGTAGIQGYPDHADYHRRDAAPLALSLMICDPVFSGQCWLRDPPDPLTHTQWPVRHVSTSGG
ncbi:heat shock transcription factor, X-linked-like [Cynocephalus volans]|uniref:heat shock transcription factor, X-linked-like n=1 Tax=Cynocephalus volans TaxID=110931 RepID=UPI002FC626ED